MNLIVFRHGRAEAQAASGRDADRELTAAGREQLARAAITWAHLAPLPEVIVSSPLSRARESAAVLAAACGAPAPRLDQDLRLQPESDPLEVLGILPAASTVWVVSHMPLLGELVGRLLAGTDRGLIPLGTGDGIWLELHEPKHAWSARLVAALDESTAAELAARYEHG